MRAPGPGGSCAGRGGGSGRRLPGESRGDASGQGATSAWAESSVSSSHAPWRGLPRPRPREGGAQTTPPGTGLPDHAQGVGLPDHASRQRASGLRPREPRFLASPWKAGWRWGLQTPFPGMGLSATPQGSWGALGHAPRKGALRLHPGMGMGAPSPELVWTPGFSGAAKLGVHISLLPRGSQLGPSYLMCRERGDVEPTPEGVRIEGQLCWALGLSMDRFFSL